MQILGYSDRLSVAPGDSIRFMVSTTRPHYRAQLVRLIHGDTNPDGPGVKEQEIASALDGEHPGRFQALAVGSYGLVPDHPLLHLDRSFTLQAWIEPRTTGRGAQGIVTRWSARTETGYALVLDEDGSLGFWAGDGSAVARAATGVPLAAGEWAFVVAAFDAARGVVRLIQRPIRRTAHGLGEADVEAPLELRAPGDAAGPLVVAGWLEQGGTSRRRIGGLFNGKIDAPRVFRESLAPAEIEALRLEVSPVRVGGARLVAGYDLSLDIPSQRMSDISGNELHGELVNVPMRAVTGHNWTGREIDWRQAPGEYGAVTFHDDDLENAGWEVDLELDVPALRSGVYALRLRSDDAEDYLPFFVRPPRGIATAPIAFLAPTNSYLAYANEHFSWFNPAFRDFTVGDPLERLQPQDRYMADNRLLSLYDAHTDGTGVCYSSYLRPVLSLRPKFFMQLIRAPHQFNADLHLVDWLAEKGFAHDVITDHDLHAEGVALLERYRVVVTGSHPEYWTGQMLDALERYLDRGGRLVYLGGNGFWWVTSIHPDRPHVIEVRRGLAGTRPWSSAPGEVHLGGTGEHGGQWHLRGRSPQKLCGVGYTGQGSDASVPFTRREGSFDDRASWIFAGVGDDEVIGDFGLVLGAAGGAEIDRADPALGTPPHALVLATASGFTDAYQSALDDSLWHDTRRAGDVNPLLRADMVYFETAGGGEVFSTGSISWCGSLSHNDYDNNVSRITENVLRRFSASRERSSADGV